VETRLGRKNDGRKKTGQRRRLSCYNYSRSRKNCKPRKGGKIAGPLARSREEKWRRIKERFRAMSLALKYFQVSSTFSASYG